MVWPSVQRSGRTSIRATTRSLSASVKVTPFRLAKGICIELTFSSGVIWQCSRFLLPSYQFFGMMDCRGKPGNDVRGSCRDNTRIILHIIPPCPPRRIVCLTEETVETLYLLGEQDRIVGVSGYAVRPPRVRREKPRVSAFISANIPKILALEPDLVLAFSDLQAEIVSDLVRAGIAIHVFNQRDVAGILAMIRTLGALVDAAERAERLATGYERRLAEIASTARPPPKPKV